MLGHAGVGGVRRCRTVEVYEDTMEDRRCKCGSVEV